MRMKGKMFFICVVHRKLLVFGGGVSTRTEDRLLHPAVIHTVAADRHVVVGRILDQQELGPGASISGSDHRPDDDNNSGDIEARQRVVPQGVRRLVRRLYGLRVRRTARIRFRQRVCPQRKTGDRQH